MEDGQNTKNQQSTDINYQSAIGINFPLLLLQPSSKLRKSLISIWRIRILGFHHYGNTPLQPYWAMTLLVTLALPLGNGYTSKVYTTSWTYSVGTKMNSKLFLPSSLSDCPSTSDCSSAIITSPSDHPSPPDHLYDKTPSPSACLSMSGCLTKTMTHPTALLEALKSPF